MSRSEYSYAEMLQLVCILYREQTEEGVKMGGGKHNYAGNIVFNVVFPFTLLAIDL